MNDENSSNRSDVLGGIVIFLNAVLLVLLCMRYSLLAKGVSSVGVIGGDGPTAVYVAKGDVDIRKKKTILAGIIINTALLVIRLLRRRR